MSIYKGDKIIAGVSGGGGGDIPADIADQLAKKENKSNKVTAINSNATDVQYPSAKAVNDSLAQKEDKSNKVTVIDPDLATASDEHYPSEKAVVRAIDQVIGGLIDHELNEKEDKSNKVTVINSTATDDQYPSAKAVNDAMSNVSIPTPNWAKAVYVTNEEMKTVNGYVSPSDGWFICSGVAPAEGDIRSKEIFINNYAIAYGERTSTYIAYGSASCTLRKGDIIKTNASAATSQKCIFLPYK